MKSELDYECEEQDLQMTTKTRVLMDIRQLLARGNMSMEEIAKEVKRSRGVHKSIFDAIWHGVGVTAAEIKKAFKDG